MIYPQLITDLVDVTEEVIESSDVTRGRAELVSEVRIMSYRGYKVMVGWGVMVSWVTEHTSPHWRIEIVNNINYQTLYKHFSIINYQTLIIFMWLLS